MKCLFIMFILVTCCQDALCQVVDSDQFYREIANKKNGAAFFKSAFLKNKWIANGEYLVLIGVHNDTVSVDVLTFKGNVKDKTKLVHSLEQFVSGYDTSKLFEDSRLYVIPLVVLSGIHEPCESRFKEFYENFGSNQASCVLWPVIRATYYSPRRE